MSAVSTAAHGPNALTLEGAAPVSTRAPAGIPRGTSGQSDTIPLESREYWRKWLNARCLQFAALLNLVPWGEKQLAKLPNHVHGVAVRIISDLQERACRGELARGGRRTERLHDDAQRELWRTLRPFAQRGEHYVEHLVGPPEVQQEFLARIGEGGIVPRGTVSPAIQTFNPTADVVRDAD